MAKVSAPCWAGIQSNHIHPIDIIKQFGFFLGGQTEVHIPAKDTCRCCGMVSPHCVKLLGKSPTCL